MTMCARISIHFSKTEVYDIYHMPPGASPYKKIIRLYVSVNVEHLVKLLNSCYNLYCYQLNCVQAELSPAFL